MPSFVTCQDSHLSVHTNQMDPSLLLWAECLVHGSKKGHCHVWTGSLCAINSSLGKQWVLHPLAREARTMYAQLFPIRTVSTSLWLLWGNVWFTKKWNFPSNILLGWQVCYWNQGLKNHAPVVISISGSWLCRDTWSTERPASPTPTAQAMPGLLSLERPGTTEPCAVWAGAPLTGSARTCATVPPHTIVPQAQALGQPSFTPQCDGTHAHMRTHTHTHTRVHTHSTSLLLGLK